MKTLGELVLVARAECGALLMGVLNMTPDSFFDGGRYSAEDKTRARIDRLLQDGCDVIDVGAESTRPGAEKVSAQEQIKRAAPAIAYAVAQGATVSIDTGSAAVAREALKLGARIVNDVTCLSDPELAVASAEADADLIIMHSRGSMTLMKGFSEYAANAYDDIVSDVSREWKDAESRAVRAGHEKDRLWFDPGLGFHKSAKHCMEIMHRLGEFQGMGAGLVLGASRKSFIASVDNAPPERRLGGSIVACLRGIQAGASVLRVHDVHETRQALLVQRSWCPKAQGQEVAHA